MIWAAAASAAAAFSAYNHVFWVGAVFAMMIPWALVCAGNWVDAAWRAKVGLCVYLLLSAVLCIYPTYIDERFNRPDADPSYTPEQQAEIDERSRDGEFGFGRFVRANIPFRLVRGLDLKGGYRVEYVVDVQEAIKDKRDRAYDNIRVTLARKFGITKEDAYPTPAEIDKLKERVVLSKPKEDVGKLSLAFTNEEDAKVINDEFKKPYVSEYAISPSADRKTFTFKMTKDAEEAYRKRAVDEAREKIHRRVDGLGLKEAAVSPRGDSIVVEVPGSDQSEFKRIRDTIQQTARLEFKLPDDGTDFFGPMRNNCPTCEAEGIYFDQDNVPGYPNLVTSAVLMKRPGESMKDAKDRFKAWVTANVEVDDLHAIVFGKETRFNEDTGIHDEIGWRTFYVFSKAEITGDMIQEASKSRDASSGGLGGWQVNLEFTAGGSNEFERITGANVGKRFLIILDEVVESGPVINQKISGSARITMGRGSPEDQLQNASNLELVIKSGALPAPIEFKGEQKIGPSLGADAINQGLKGAGFGFLAIFIVMVVIYARAGMIANIAVLFNLLLQMMALTMFGAALTLPGLAGLALTAGIAVDANVLINERIRDELRAGKSSRQAVDIGYDRAFSAIIDGHVTTFISGIILLHYGSGPIKGFAVTLMIGMITSLFTAVICTRLVFDWVVRWRKVKQLSLG
ncbi:MAG: protein translocase subunit SecD [Polyangiaceae bacterium]|nr:protein translocase subunit SecD [Polyangiaceae bacterium]